MDLRKIKKLIDLLEESNLAEIEIKEGEESVRISRHSKQAAMAQPIYAAAPMAAPVADAPAPGDSGSTPRPAWPSAASILAKTHRDALMRELHAAHPQYGFDRNMGYGSAAHLAADCLLPTTA